MAPNPNLGPNRSHGREPYDVAVVGFGPSGATAAGLLGSHGLSTFVCDRTGQVYDKPRAIALDHEVLRVFQQIGVVDAIRPYFEPFTPSEYFGVDGQLIKRLTMVAPPYPMGYTPSNVFSQPPVEAALRAQVAALPTVTTCLGVEVVGVEQDADAVSLRLRHADGRAETVRARYVIACDGASSFVREAVGIRLEDLAFDEPWLVVDVRVNARGLARLPKTSVQYCEPDRPASFLIGPGNHRRWEISLHEDEDPKQAATPEATWQLLSRWITPQDGELWRQASYRFHALVAREWRQKRVFVAGDAAHQQPPFLGQGMCQGIRDVANLSWKLRAVLRGEVEGAAAEDLLDSYGQERKQHVGDLTATIKDIGAVICERDVDRARQRDADLLAACDGQVQDTPRQDVLPALRTGFLSETKSSARGTLFPQPRIRRPGREPGLLYEPGLHDEPVLLDELAGTGWRLVFAPGGGLDAALPPLLPPLPPLLPSLPPLLPSLPPLLPSLPPLLPSLPPPAGLEVVALGHAGWSEAEPVLQPWFERHACRAALVRPDHYVFGVAGTPAELDALLQEWAMRCGEVAIAS